MSFLRNQVSSFTEGRLKNFVPQWQEITSDKMVLGFVRGYDIEIDEQKPLDYRLSVSVVNGRKLPPAEENIFKSEIEKLLEKGVIEKVFHTAGEFICQFS